MAETSTLNLSDEEFMNQAPPEFVDEEPTDSEKLDISESTDSDKEETTDTSESEYSDKNTSDQAEENSEAQEQPEDGLEEEQVSQPEGDTQTEQEISPDSTDTESLDTSDADKSDTKEDTQDTEKFDYESAFKKVTEPFKANGVDMQVKNPQDIVRLMQMGANYAKKMSQLKPNLKIIKMLENNELLDEAKLHNLIDLSKKDPKAVAKLIKESGIDPLDIDTEKSTDYQATDYSITDKEYNLDQVLESIKDSPTFNKTIDVLTKDWDAASKTTISDNPEVISIIDSHMASGVFDKVNANLQQQKSLGKLSNISDVQAYYQIAESMYNAGQLGEVDSGDNSTVSSKTEPDLATAAARKKKKQAVAPVKKTTAKTQKLEEDFLGLSDDEFMKKFGGR